MIKTAIFDLDGTVAHTLPDLVTAINGIRASRSLAPLSDEEALVFINGDTEQVVRASIPNIAESEVDDAVAEFKAIYSECYLDKTYPYAGMKDMLSSLKALGIKLALFSNKADEYVKNMAAKFYPGLFEIALGSGVFASKPSPEGVYDILSKLETEKDNAVLIGDSDVDLATAANAGVKVIGVSWGYRGRKFLEKNGCGQIVDTVNEIKEKILNTD